MPMSKDHFQTKDTINGRMLITPKILEPTFVLFYTTTCGVCKLALPMYDQMSRSLPYRFAICNVQTQADVLRMSESTISPIRHVPMLFLYAKGWPYMVYKDNWQPEKLQQFLHSAWNKAQQQMGAGQQAPQQAPQMGYHPQQQQGFAPGASGRPRIEAQQYPVSNGQQQAQHSSSQYQAESSSSFQVEATCEGDTCGALIPFNEVLCSNSHGCYAESGLPAV